MRPLYLLKALEASVATVECPYAMSVRGGTGHLPQVFGVLDFFKLNT